MLTQNYSNFSAYKVYCFFLFVLLEAMPQAMKPHVMRLQKYKLQTFPEKGYNYFNEPYSKKI